MQRTYLELRNQQSDAAWKIGMMRDNKLHVGYGRMDTPGKISDAIVMPDTGDVIFHGNVEVKGRMYKNYVNMQCLNSDVVATDLNQIGTATWTPWATCPKGYAAVGIGHMSHLDQLSPQTVDVYPQIEAVECKSFGCRASCRSTRCQVRTRCCRSASGPLHCQASVNPEVTQLADQWGTSSGCRANGENFSATGFAKLMMYTKDNAFVKRYIKGLKIEESSANAFIKSNRQDSGAVRAQCCRPYKTGHVLKCMKGSLSQSSDSAGPSSMWGPYSTCPADFQAVGIAQLEVIGDRPSMAIRKFECDETGCRAWCDGSSCAVNAQCCRIVLKQSGV